jgi:hypothetical protein
MDRLACSFPGAKRAGPSGSSWPRSARPCPPAWACTWSATNLATRKAPVIQEWLARHPRFYLHFTSAGSSGINQVER